jgi:hypothetical protein
MVLGVAGWPLAVTPDRSFDGKPGLRLPNNRAAH